MRTDVTITRRSVKHARLRVREDASVELVVPADFTEREIESILQRKGVWIVRHQDFFRSHQSHCQELAKDEFALFGKVFRFISVPEMKRVVRIDEYRQTLRSGRDLQSETVRLQWYRSFARGYLCRRVAELSQSHGLTYRKVFIRSQRTRWGGCSPAHNISLNWRLVQAPEYVIDYVILHELVHTQVLNHSQRFWILLRALCKDHSKAIDWLNRHRISLIVAPGITSKKNSRNREPADEKWGV
jgi:predicted metal-dependent hydrolase